ncbi:helix-turn-helix transcriptional regulator [Jiangella asiatica]|nr:helix-turn-helix transcriptional regulator [Jiangella asiatica]
MTRLRTVVPLLLVSVVVCTVSVGLAHGIWLSNLHNGLLALAFGFVGGYVLVQRPGHREGVLFVATGLVEAVMFTGRQIGHSPTSDADRWWGWLGVWPLAIALALTTLSVLCFPNGRLPSPGWRWVAGVVVAIAVVCSGLSALWPVEYDATGMVTPHPINPADHAGAARVWDAIAHPAYAGFQVLWLVAVVARWRASGGQVRRQLTWLLGAAGLSVLALLVGLIGWGTHLPGVLSAALLPLAAGWAILHGQQLAAYSALTWLSRTDTTSPDLPGDFAKALAEAFSAPGATVWMGDGTALHAVGVWPETSAVIPQTTAERLAGSPSRHARLVEQGGAVIGAISVDRVSTDRLSLAEHRLFADLVAQAALVLDHVNLAEIVARQRRAGRLDGLTQREVEVLELMARGLSNQAICEQLHLSVKTVEPAVGSIYTKLGLTADANRRVLAVLAYLREG